MLRAKAFIAMIISGLLSVGCASSLLLSAGPAPVTVSAGSGGGAQVASPATGGAAPDSPPAAPATDMPAWPDPAPHAEPAPVPDTVTPAPQPTANYDPYIHGAPALAPVDPLMPAPGDVQAVWQPLDETVRRIAADYEGRLSVVAVDLTDGARYEFRPNDEYYPASTFKLPVTICTVQAIERGELTWDTLVTFTKEDDDTVGQGGFADVDYGTKWPVRNLLDRSLISSNNVAVKMLARTLTLEKLAECTAAMGGMVTRTEDGSTPVSAPDEAAWWQAVWQMKQQKPQLAENLLSPLRRVTYWGRISAGTPRSDLVTHKFGTFPPYEHDGAIVWGERPYILVVLTYGGHDAADQAIAQIARAAWDAIYAK
ncbi:MAG: putative beta-lactamase [Symbiobacteriaceae bacterium]|jgi:beta-lactamase class A|nr:putative beta-lactamase [Symbiobacteriaceae bacterium]